MRPRFVLQHTEPGRDGVVFHLFQDGTALPPDRWPAGEASLDDDHQRPACKDALLRLLDEGLAVPAQDSTGPGVLVDHHAIAALPCRQLACLGLPQRSPHVLQVSGNGPIAAPDFRFAVRLIAPSGIPLAGFRRVGAFLEGSTSDTWTLPLPYLEVLEAIDAWEARDTDATLEERMALIGRVLELLPDDARVDDTLRTIHVRWCDSFTLLPFRNQQNEPDFDPVPLARPAPDPADDGEPRPALKGSRQKFFADQFRRRSSVYPSYAAGHGWYVLLSPRAVAALKVAKEIQSDTDPRRRLAFLRNPHAFLRGALEDALSPRDLEEVFLETPEFSERVHSIGAWQPPSLPFYQSGTDWLPPARPEAVDKPKPQTGETTGTAEALLEDEPPAVVIEDCRIPRDEVEDLAHAVAVAMDEGRDVVEWRGQQIPATREVYRTLQTALERPRSSNPEPIVLQPRQNLEDVSFREKFRRHQAFPITLPASLRSHLFPHQEEGLRWLQASWLAGVPGVLLGDDMGLGKTLQVLSFLAWLRQALRARGAAARFLVVGPTALIQNWIAEIGRHFDEDTFGEVVPLQGARIRDYRLSMAGSGKETIGGLPVLDTVRLRDAGMVLCSYEVLRDYQHSLGSIPWTVMALDEAQKIKNPTTLVSSVARAMNAEMVVAMTGTPVENRMADLWSILDAIRPGRYGSLRDFVRKFEGPFAEIEDELKRLGKDLASPDGDGSPIMLRRLKKDHVEGLPGLHLHRIREPMPVEQARAYDNVVDSARGADVTGRHILTIIQQLRAVSLHPALHDEGLPEDPSLSARFATLLRVLDDVSERGDKALVFVDSRPAQDMLVGLLARRYHLEHPPFVINGAVPGGARKRRIDEFQDRPGFDVLILSPMAAGVGLNLVAANHVIHLGRWWNPAVEDQATDRAYRIGQKRDVHVYVPLAIHPNHGDASFDVKLDALLEHKRALHHTLLAPAAASRQELQQFLAELLGE